MTATWALVEDGRVRSIARTDQSPGKGWLPVDTVVPDHDPATHRPTGGTFDVGTERVVATYRIVEIVEPDDPPDDEPEATPQPQAVREGYRRDIARAIEQAIGRLDALAAAPALPEVPSGTLTTAQLSHVARELRGHVQANRSGAQEVAVILRNLIRLVRGDFDGPATPLPGT